MSRKVVDMLGTTSTITVKDYILAGLLKEAKDRLEKLTKFNAPKVVVDGQRKFVERLEAGDLKISGDKDALDDTFQSREFRKGHGGKTYIVINGNINYFPAAQYGPYIKRT